MMFDEDCWKSVMLFKIVMAARVVGIFVLPIVPIFYIVVGIVCSSGGCTGNYKTLWVCYLIFSQGK
jgi:hypothetical protein